MQVYSSWINLIELAKSMMNELIFLIRLFVVCGLVLTLSNCQEAKLKEQIPLEVGDYPILSQSFHIMQQLYDVDTIWINSEVEKEGAREMQFQAIKEDSDLENECKFFIESPYLTIKSDLRSVNYKKIRIKNLITVKSDGLYLSEIVYFTCSEEKRAHFLIYWVSSPKVCQSVSFYFKKNKKGYYELDSFYEVDLTIN